MADFWSQFQPANPTQQSQQPAWQRLMDAPDQGGYMGDVQARLRQSYDYTNDPTRAQTVGAPQVGPAVNQNMQQGQATLLSGAPALNLPPNYALPGGPNLNPVGGTVYNPGTGQTVGSGSTTPTDPRFQTAGPANPSQQSQQPTSGGMPDPKTAFMEAVQALGVTPQQFRSNPQVMDRVTNYLNQKYPGMNWSNGGQKAGDWVSVNGQGFDVLPAGDRSFQWLSDPAGSQAGAGGGGYWMGDQTGGGQFPLAAAGGPGLAEPWTTPFKAPDNLTEQNDPGFQARMKMGTDAIQRNAAAKGTLLTGGLLKGLDRYAQDYASNEYQNVYNRALGQYQMAYDIFNNNGNTLFNRLGQLGSIGENAAAGVGNSQIGVGNAQAAGSINQGNIWGNVANQAGQAANNIYLNKALAPKTPPIDYGSSYTGTPAGYGQYYPAGTFTP